MHIHLDKTFYGGSWQATRRRTGGVKGMIALEQEICLRCSKPLRTAPWSSSNCFNRKGLLLQEVM
nr:hypothetical protein [Niabella hibiscisoli]